jgi:hypothetical protein
VRIPYVVSRAVVAAVLAVALYFGGLPWWSAALTYALSDLFLRRTA